MKKLKRMYRCIEELKYGNGKTTGCPTKTFGHDRQCGFTLVELVIVIAIVIILSVISVPIYRGYVDKAKMAEGYALCGIILSAQKAYYSEYGNFLRAIESSVGDGRWTCNETVLGIDARGNKYFTRFVVGQSDNSRDVRTFFKCLVEKPKELRNIKGTSNLRLFYDMNTSPSIFFVED